MKKIICSLTILSTFLLQGCGDKMPPTCNDSKTKGLLQQLIDNKIRPYGVNASITGMEMLEEHKEAKEYTCQARVILSAANGTTSRLIDYSVFLDDNKKGKFFVQLNDDDDSE